MQVNAAEITVTIDTGRALTETELQAVAAGFGGLALQRAIEIYTEQQRIEALYADRK
jgi:hypothetical protein